MVTRLMYDSGSPPTTFAPGEPWAGYLNSPHPFATWPVEALKAAIDNAGLCPTWGAPLNAASLHSSNPADEAHEAVRQVKALGGGSVVVASDYEEVGYEADRPGSVQWSLKFGQAVIHEGGLWVAYGGKEYLADLLVALRRTSLKCAPWVANYTTHPGYPAAGWPVGDRGWQYAADVSHNGHNVDLSTIEPGFPLIHKAVPANQPTRLSWTATHHAKRLHSLLEKRTDPISPGPRREALKGAESEIVRTLGLH